jgi:threonyl-tRNA synthetase
MGEFGSCHRNEPSGSLHGLMRVRGFTQDDAHIFCTEEQVRAEVNECIRMVYDVYGTFGFDKIAVKLSTRPEKRIGTDDMWTRAEEDLAAALTENGIPFEYQPGEGAFYGPKIEFTLHDCLDRAWQCGTVQLDFFLPGRLGRIVCWRKQRSRGPGNDSPRYFGLHGAFHRYSYRRVRRVLPNLDCSGAGGGDEYHRQPV